MLHACFLNTEYVVTYSSYGIMATMIECHVTNSNTLLVLSCYFVNFRLPNNTDERIGRNRVGVTGGHKELLCRRTRATATLILVALPAGTRNFYVDGHVPQPH